MNIMGGPMNKPVGPQGKQPMRPGFMPPMQGKPVPPGGKPGMPMRPAVMPPSMGQNKPVGPGGKPPMPNMPGMPGMQMPHNLDELGSRYDQLRGQIGGQIGGQLPSSADIRQKLEAMMAGRGGQMGAAVMPPQGNPMDMKNFDMQRIQQALGNMGGRR